MTNMDSFGGYVRLYRKLLQNPIWTQLSPAVLKVAVYFLMRAGYKCCQWYDGRGDVDIPAGSFITSYARTAAACNISAQQTRDAFSHLSKTHFATYRRTRRWTLVTVLNWAAYQAQQLGGEDNQEQNADRVKNTTEAPQGTTNKNERSKETNICSSDDERGCEILSVNQPPFKTTESKPLFPREAIPISRPSRAMTPEQERWFDAWWAKYWRRRSKKDAREAFRKHVQSEERFQKIMAATCAQNPEMLLRPADKRPYGATWLNGERWEDEITSPAPPAAQDDYPDYPELTA